MEERNPHLGSVVNVPEVIETDYLMQKNLPLSDGSFYPALGEQIENCGKSGSVLGLVFHWTWFELGGVSFDLPSFGEVLLIRSFYAWSVCATMPELLKLLQLFFPPRIADL